MLVNIVMFFCGRSLGGGRKIPDRFTNASYEVS